MYSSSRSARFRHGLRAQPSLWGSEIKSLLLKHYGLVSIVAIRLRSVHTRDKDFILEFFLLMDCVESEKQQQMLSSLLITMQHICQSLLTLSDREQRESCASTR
uniref:NLP1-9 GAF domain-containing protein n=1 Tax=Physcomitrium patens TaxID=3218 RepID=A0A2K1KMN4_PHYPA|nr:hypothetical protein PHYPA_005933 [Physcomitrium patens]